MAHVKVKLTKQAGQSGLRPIGTVLHVSSEIADSWVSLGIAKKIAKRRAKKKTDDKSNENTNG